MATSFLGRWFGGKPSAPAADEARTEIDRLLAERPELSGPLGWLRAVLDDLVPDPAYITAALPAPEVVREELHFGRPVLRYARPGVEPAGFARRWQRVCDALAEARLGAAARRLDPNPLAVALIDDTPDVIRDAAGGLGVDPGLFGTLLRFTLFAGFAALDVEAALLRQGAIWERGYCPTCGGGPLLGEFRGLDQSRFLRCGLCAASWEVPRQWCPGCGNRDHETLGFLAKEGEESRYRVATCDRCRGGVKMLSTLSALPPLMLLVADAATLHLDLAAADRGFGPPLPQGERGEG